jgi:hypothetical protein
MKTFKGKSKTAPVEKDRKEQGKYQENISHKQVSSRRKITSSYLNKEKDLGNLPSSKPVRKKYKKWGYFEYFIIMIIFGIIFLFIILLISVIFFKDNKKEFNNEIKLKKNEKTNFELFNDNNKLNKKNKKIKNVKKKENEL